jgi:hypothetical protein
MKRIYSIISLVAIAILFTVSSCEERLNYEYQEKDMVEFANSSQTVEILKKPAVDTTVQVKVQILGKQQSSEQTIAFEVVGGESSAIPEVHYEIMAENITIPANSSFGYLPVKVIHKGFMVEEKVNLKIKLLGHASDMPVNLNQRTTDITLYKKNVCPLTYDDIVGIWNVNDVSEYDGAYQTYQVELVHVNEDTMMVKGLWPFEIVSGVHPDVMVLVDLTPGQETFSIPTQYYADHPSYGEVTFDELYPPSRLNTCEKTISTSYQISVEAGYFERATSNWSYVGPASEKKAVPYKEAKFYRE